MREDLEARLDHIAGELEAGRTPPTATVRSSCPGSAKNRSANNIRTLSMAFARRGLATDVVLQSADREAPITFALAQGQVSEAVGASGPELTAVEVTDIEEAFIDPTHKLSDLRVLQRTLVSVTANDSLEHALSTMGAHGLAFLRSCPDSTTSTGSSAGKTSARGSPMVSRVRRSGTTCLPTWSWSARPCPAERRSTGAPIRLRRGAGIEVPHHGDRDGGGPHGSSSERLAEPFLRILRSSSTFAA